MDDEIAVQVAAITLYRTVRVGDLGDALLRVAAERHASAVALGDTATAEGEHVAVRIGDLADAAAPARSGSLHKQVHVPRPRGQPITGIPRNREGRAMSAAQAGFLKISVARQALRTEVRTRPDVPASGKYTTCTPKRSNRRSRT